MECCRGLAARLVLNRSLRRIEAEFAASQFGWHQNLGQRSALPTTMHKSFLGLGKFWTTDQSNAPEPQPKSISTALQMSMDDTNALIEQRKAKLAALRA